MLNWEHGETWKYSYELSLHCCNIALIISIYHELFGFIMTNLHGLWYQNQVLHPRDQGVPLVHDFSVWFCCFRSALKTKSYAMLCREWTNENMLKRCKDCRCLDSSEWLSEQHCMPISDAIPLSLDSQVPFPAANATPTCPSQNLRARELCKLCRGNVCSVRKCSIYHLPHRHSYACSNRW